MPKSTAKAKAKTDSKIQKKSNKNKLISIGVVSVLAVIGLATIAVNLANGNNPTPSNSASTSISVGSSEATATIGGNQDQNSTAPSYTTKAKASEIDQGREKYQNVLANNLDTAKIDEAIQAPVYTVDKIKEIKTDITSKLGSDAAVTTKVTNKTFNIELSYSNAGDEAFEKATLYIKLSEGARIVESSLEDNFEGNRQAISPTLYDREKNLIRYAPGTGSAVEGSVKAGQSGKVSFTVEILDETKEVYGIISYLKDDSGKTGVPGNLFIEL